MPVAATAPQATRAPSSTSSVADHFTAALEAAIAAPTDSAALSAFRAARLELAQAVAELAPTELQSPLATAARSAVTALCASGLLDLAPEPAETALLAELHPRQWNQLLAGMLLTAAWRWDAAPSFDDVPNDLWGLFARWSLLPVQSFTQLGDAQRYADAQLPRLESLAKWVERNWGSAAVRAATQAYLATSNSIPLYFSAGDLRRHAEARGRILQRAFNTDPAGTIRPEAFERYGRPLRIGFVNRHFGSQTETYTTLPTFEHLDPERYELVLFSLHENGSTLENHCRSRATEFHVLPADDVPAQVETIRLAAVDVLVFGTNVTAVVNEVTRLATHRMAPLQVVNNSSCITSGLPEVDVYVSGDLTEITDAARQFSERLALLPGPAHAFNYEADAEEPTTSPTRADYGIADDALLFVSAANYYKLVPEIQHTWAKLLTAHPTAHLLVHPFNPNWSSSYPMERFRAEFDAVLAAHGVTADRLTISDTFFPSRTDVKQLLALGDIYLDTFPFSGVNSLVDPLELGLPVVAWDGETFRSRMAGALLRQLELPEFIATDEASYLQIVWQLATDPAHRATTAQRIQNAMHGAPLFLDPLAASDAFGALMEQAYDDLATQGVRPFTKQADRVIQVDRDIDVAALLAEAKSAAEIYDFEGVLTATRAILAVRPNHPEARRAHARALLETHRADRATTYFLSSLQGAEEDATIWFDVARALHASGDTAQALAALEASLRLDAGNLEGWIMMADLADAAGSTDIAEEARNVARQLAPEDPRLAAA
ncbi:tetratricopeptide repeat protein [Actomonas aquatica]|uniref:O-GlcNAc transferase C-terminal domain-containing protein n=1 Tax=Actomonas aquatica TaxID=2866162 RepID=A0ABZ1CDC0_9BACT|nr:tetratricopeptide repeat protein [Opitutus sp. WL0086]WRQ89302.1 hypothetical protein K1X11_007770 [Opitutus sp. WL0086]